MYTLIQTAKLNSVDPQAWLGDVLTRIADTPQTKLAQLLPWNWNAKLACQELRKVRPTPEGYGQAAPRHSASHTHGGR